MSQNVQVPPRPRPQPEGEAAWAAALREGVRELARFMPC